MANFWAHFDSDGRSSDLFSPSYCAYGLPARFSGQWLAERRDQQKITAAGTVTDFHRIPYYRLQ